MMINSNTGYCMLLGISLLLTPEVHSSEDWPKDRRLKNSRRASDEFELFRNQHTQHYQRGHHHQHHKLYSDGYSIVDISSNKSSPNIPGEDFLVTKSAHSSNLANQHQQRQKLSHYISDLQKIKLSVNDSSSSLSSIPSLPSPSRLVSSGDSNVDLTNSIVGQLGDDAKKRTSTEDSYEEDDRRILFASKVTSNVIKGPSYESSSSSGQSPTASASLSIGQGSKTSSITGYTFDGSKNAITNNAKHHLKPAITKISLSLGGNSNHNNNANHNNHKINVASTTNSGQSNDIFNNHYYSNDNKKITFGGEGDGGGQSNEIKINSLVGGSTATITTIKESDDSNSYGSPNAKSNNKANIMSSALNVIGGNDDNTQLAHSILVVQRPKNRPKPIGSVGNGFYWDNTMFTDDSGPSLVNSESTSSTTTSSTTTTTSTSTTTETPLPVLSPSSNGETLHSNHRPQGKPNKTRPWLRPISTTKRKKPPVTLITSANSSPDLSMMPRTTGVPFPFFDDEVPILMSNNHRKFPYSLTTRNKLTSEYANYWTTPSTTALYNDYSVFNKIPSKLPSNNRRRSTTTTTTTPSPQMIMGSKPPLKVSHVIASKNKEPDEVKSSVLTVLDPQGGSAHLPPNTSIVHRNVLVPYRPGRPKPAPVSTTQYPIYPILAGITNWPIQNNHSSINGINDMNGWQWDENDNYSGTTVPPPAFSVPIDPVTTSKSPYEYLDPIPVSSINRPTIAIIGSRPGGFGAFRPTPTAIITSSPSSSSTSTVGSAIPTPAQSFLISDVQMQQHQQHQQQHHHHHHQQQQQQQHISQSTPSTTTQHVISVTPIVSSTGHVIPSSVNTSSGQHHQHIFGEVIHSSRPPSATAAGHQSDVNLSSAAAAAASTASTSSSLSTSGSSQSFIVTTTTTTESSKPMKDTYVHAIYAPPMPSTLPKPAIVPESTSSLLALFGVDSFSGLFTQLTVFKALLFTALVILLPPLTVAAAFSSLAG